MKPCPFDDNYAGLQEVDQELFPSVPGYYYECVYCQIHTGIYDTKEEAELAWNAYNFKGDND